MPQDKQRLLVEKVKDVLHRVEAEDLTSFSNMLAGDPDLRREILVKIAEIIEQQANVKISNFDF